ncbi:DUF1636 family protein [Ruegeria arenilitoris]|uniref:DUF1636 family protein n=1 Tax=Ruegeria arenilitoris TaxID=1173585 RepID=UPI00147D663E|nr:DUF1636 domain-containing protein [Ruegeria arenilitoris]
MPETPDHFLLICETCKGPENADALRTALEGNLPAGFAVRTVDCMAGCERPTTVGFQAVGKAQYLFGDIQSERDINAVTEFARQFHDRADGWTNATDRPRALFTKTLARMPCLNVEEHP